MTAPDEIPPHQQLLGKRRAAQQQNAAGLIAVVMQRHGGAARALVAQVADGQRGAVQGDDALVAQHAVFERGVETSATRAPGSMSSWAPSSGVKVCTGDRLPASCPRKIRATAPGSEIGSGA